MARGKISSKHIQIDKAQVTIVAVAAATVFVTVFSLTSAKALLTQRSYQNRVIEKKEKAKKSLEDNIAEVGKLTESYKEFTSRSENLIKGNPAGTGERDGDNARLVLDALPSKYDFPAVASSLEKILNEKKFKIDGIAGSDDELTQSANLKSGSPKPVEIPFSISVSGSYNSIQDLIGVFERSIRPFKISSVSLSGNQNEMKFSMKSATYYQPEKSFDIKMETVK